MKIAIYTDNFFPELSGITDSLSLLGTSLRDLGHQVLFVGPRYGARDFAAVKLPFVEKDFGPGIEVVRQFSLPFWGSPTGQGRIAVPIFSTLPAIRRFKPDIIHTQTPYGAGIEALLIAKLLRIPLVGTNHTPVSEFIRYMPIRGKLFTAFVMHYFSWYYNRCTFVSAPCQSLLDEMKTFGLSSPSRPVSNPINLRDFKPTRDEQERQNAKKTFGLNGPTILYTGRLSEEKHVDVIIRALPLVRAKVPNAKLVVTGHGQVQKDLQALAAKLGVSNHVIFPGFIPDQNYPTIYKAADVFVIMSTAESQSLSLMQAMATGVPCIGARARALPEYIGTKAGLTVPPGNHEELARSIVELLTNGEMRQIMTKGGFEVAASCEPKVIANKWAGIFSANLGKK